MKVNTSFSFLIRANLRENYKVDGERLLKKGICPEPYLCLAEKYFSRLLSLKQGEGEGPGQEVPRAYEEPASLALLSGPQALWLTS